MKWINIFFKEAFEPFKHLYQIFNIIVNFKIKTIIFLPSPV